MESIDISVDKDKGADLHNVPKNIFEDSIETYKIISALWQLKNNAPN